MSDLKYDEIQSHLYHYWTQVDIKNVSPATGTFLTEVYIALQKLIEDVQELKNKNE